MEFCRNINIGELINNVDSSMALFYDISTYHVNFDCPGQSNGGKFALTA